MTPCMVWPGYIDKHGYGREYWQGKTYLPHRAAYERAYGAIPAGLTIDHLCRNRACVNPEHLEAVTTRENTLRGEGLSARNARATHCVHGHLFDEPNTYRHDGKRDCRKCLRAAQNRYAQRTAVIRKERTHCPKGHPYDEANMKVRASSATGRPTRWCRACANERNRAYRRRRKLAHV